ncbi:MAG: homocysteine S-methyltransferase family protein [Ignavibacteriales bacterium]|nr:homocysteine S-methyltransferase family protein [Ignavibacteriales bacterium]
MRKDFSTLLRESRLILTEGAVIERLRREFSAELDPFIMHAGFIYDPEGRSILEKIFRQYIEIGKIKNLPMILFTPTWRANPERLQLAGLSHKDVNGDCYRFLNEIRSQYKEYGEKIFIGGLMGCKGDSYKPGFTESLGMAQAMAATEIPYVISFVVYPEGTLLDGTSLHTAITEIDEKVLPPPIGYMINCVHPYVFEQAIMHPHNSSDRVRKRIIGLQANTSKKRPEELDGSGKLETEEPIPFAEAIVSLNKKYGLKVLGGCCGTNDRHIKAIAEIAESDR